jgi:hypothetical protein
MTVIFVWKFEINICVTKFPELAKHKRHTGDKKTSGLNTISCILPITYGSIILCLLFIRVFQDVSLYLLITIQKATSNAQRVPPPVSRHLLTHRTALQ